MNNEQNFFFQYLLQFNIHRYLPSHGTFDHTTQLYLHTFFVFLMLNKVAGNVYAKPKKKKKKAKPAFFP